MATTITITLPTSETNRIVHALCVMANLPETPANAKQALLNYIKQTVSTVEIQESRKAAVDAVIIPGIVTPT